MCTPGRSSTATSARPDIAQSRSVRVARPPGLLAHVMIIQVRGSCEQSDAPPAAIVAGIGLSRPVHACCAVRA